MNDAVISEGDLEFSFSSADLVEKYDDWSHYRNRYNSACGGAKAVDFIVLSSK